MLLAQATGRLIRNATDRGVVAVLDRRLGTARYRWDIVRALPPMRRTRDRAEVEAFLREITAIRPPSSYARTASVRARSELRPLRRRRRRRDDHARLARQPQRAVHASWSPTCIAALDPAEAASPTASRAIVLTHSPPAFCAGADLKERRDRAARLGADGVGA